MELLDKSVGIYYTLTDYSNSFFFFLLVWVFFSNGLILILIFVFPSRIKLGLAVKGINHSVISYSCNPAGSSVHGILQTGILEGVALQVDSLLSEPSLKLNIKKKLRSWHLVPSLHGKWKGKKWKQWQIFIFLSSKITADSDYSHEIKRHSLEGNLWQT